MTQPTPKRDSTSERACSEVAPRSTRRPLPLRRKLLFASVLLVGPLLALEGGLRLFGWPTDRVRTISKLANFEKESFEETIGVFRPRATSRVSWPPELAYTARINSLGLRGPEVALKPSEGVFRVLCLGDSTTFGFYVEEAETLPQRLQGSLLEGGSAPVEVINGGCGGWSIASQARFFSERGSKLEPQLVVLTFCGNDLADLNRPPPYESHKAELGQGPGSVRRALYQTACYELILRGKIAWKRYRQKAAGEEPHPLSSVSVSGEEGERLWAAYSKHLESLRDELRRTGTPLVVSYLPDAWRLQEKLEEVDDQMLGSLCQRLGIPYVSGYSKFKAQKVEDLYHAPLDAHPSAEGNRVLAEVTAAFLIERGLVPRR